MGRRTWARRVLRGLRWLSLALVVGLLLVLLDAWTAMGTAPEGDRVARMRTSPQWSGGTFVNPQPMENDMWLGLVQWVESDAPTRPSAPLPVVRVSGERFDTPPTTGLRVTWLGHSSSIIELDGVRILTDPVWGPRTAPLTWAGPQRWYEPPLPLDELPPLDAVVISHDHYDHLDAPTITALADVDVPFIVPLGVGAHLEYWGIPTARIREVDWWDRVQLDGLEIVCTPSRHASGRHVLDQNRTLWAGYALLGRSHRVFFSGDTGLFPGLRDIGERLGPFDLTMLEVGAYSQAWPDWHLGPEQAVRAHQMLRGAVMLPIHWGLFDLAYHGWTEPIERTLAAAERAEVTVASPRPGQSVEPGALAQTERWWPDVPWQTAAQYPVVATKVDPAD